MNIYIKQNGSFTVTDGQIAVIDAYPEIDGIAVRPVRVTVDENSIVYTLLQGTLTVTLISFADNVEIHCRPDRFTSHDISPIGQAVIRGCDRIFVQGFGIGGPSGFHKLPTNQQSHGLIAVGNESECMTVSVPDHRQYSCSYRVSGDRFFAGYAVENTVIDGELPVMRLRLWKKGEGDMYSHALHICAEEIASFMNVCKVTKQAFHWCSWYYLYHNLDEPTLQQYLEGFATERKLAPFTHLQIDAGYFTSCGDWLQANPRFPHGMKAAAEMIRRYGYAAGIWVAPFMVGDCSDVAKNHPEWLLHDNDGQLHIQKRCYNEPKMWGYPDSDYYVLDTSNPEAMTYLKTVFSVLRSWGYTLYKTDFLLWGIQDSSKVRRYTPGKTSVEYFRDALRTIREAIGEDSRWLGCIAPFLPCLGYMDMMRIGGDVGAQWNENGFGPQNMLREMTADQYFNLVYWQNDPDAVMLRDFHIELTDSQVEALALLEAMSGGVMYTSDPVHLLGERRRKLLSFIRSDSLHTPEYPYWSEMNDEVCLVQRLATHTLVYFFNAGNQAILKQFDFTKLVGDRRYLYQYHVGQVTVPFVTIPARGGVLYIAADKPLAEEPTNMWEIPIA